MQRIRRAKTELAAQVTEVGIWQTAMEPEQPRKPEGSRILIESWGQSARRNQKIWSPEAADGQ